MACSSRFACSVREFQDEKAEAKRLADQAAAANRVQLTVISPNELRKLKGGKE